MEALHSQFDGQPLEDYQAFVEGIGLKTHADEAWTTDAERLQHNFDYLCDKADRFPDHQIKLCRALGLPTPDEQQAVQMQKSLEIAERSAHAAERSASASEQSASHSRSSKSAAWIAALISAGALILNWLWPRGE